MEVVINADDFGLRSEVNDAILYCFQNKLIQSTSLMVNMPFADDAVALSKEKGFAHLIGLHINLVEGCPLTERIKHTAFCDDGLFNGAIMNGKNRLMLLPNDIRAVDEEIVAQFRKFCSYGLKCHHIDSHRHAHTNWLILSVIMKHSEMLGHCPIRLSRNIPKKALEGIKGLYKKAINSRIVRYNFRFCNTSVEWFGGIKDYDAFRSEVNEVAAKSQKAEIMIHPTICDGKLADAINDESVEDWLNGKGKNAKTFEYCGSN